MIMSYKMRKMKNRLLAATLISFISVSASTACAARQIGSQAESQVEASINGKTEGGNSSTAKTSINDKSEIFVEYDSDDMDSSLKSSEAADIVLKGNVITADKDGVSIDGNKVTISLAGIYNISGKLTDGQIIVDTEDKEVVRLILNGADITSTNSAPIYVRNAKKTVITLAEGTKNKVTDSASYILEDTESDEPNAAIFCKSDLTINGNGSLTVNANYNNAVTSKDELKIVSGDMTINAAADGLRGKDYVAVKSGAITVNAKGDGIKSNNDEDAEKGFVIIDGGTINITAGEDAIQAETNILIRDGDISISSGGGSKNGIKIADMPPGMKREKVEEKSDDAVSTKGIKAEAHITIEGGTINIDSADDSVHSNSSLKINGGTIVAASGGDGIHSDDELEINGGNIDITKSYEGIESAVITINDGEVHVISSDDGINVAGENDGSNHYLFVNGGYVAVDASGDGLDANGSIKVTAGTVIVNGPANSGNGALDYDGSFEMTGGYILAAGSSGMVQAPDTSSTQYSVMLNFESALPAGTIVHIEAENGEEVITFAPKKQYQSVVLCSPMLEKGSTYTIYSGGSVGGESKDGLYSGGTYTGGTKYQSFKVSDTITRVGTFNNGNMRGGKRRPV
ncbi:MAG: hypothetical protein K0S71_2974 [Clostridia bacterium]|jgi:hypothetical protein|nr:hypothetical protein [Clostridia bacterium]